jgi:hypothetical protein
VLILSPPSGAIKLQVILISCLCLCNKVVLWLLYKSPTKLFGYNCPIVIISKITALLKSSFQLASLARGSQLESYSSVKVAISPLKGLFTRPISRRNFALS